MLITSYNIQINNVLISQLCQLKGHRLLFFWNKVMKVSLYTPNFFSFFNFELCIQELIQEGGGSCPPWDAQGGGGQKDCSSRLSTRRKMTYSLTELFQIQVLDKALTWTIHQGP